MSTAPLFVPGAPGGPELLVILLIIAIPLAVIAAVVFLVIAVSGRSSGEDEDRIADLEERIRDLEDED